MHLGYTALPIEKERRERKKENGQEGRKMEKENGENKTPQHDGLPCLEHGKSI